MKSSYLRLACLWSILCAAFFATTALSAQTAKPAVFVKFTTARGTATSPATAETLSIAAPGNGWTYSAAAPWAGTTWNLIKRPPSPGIPSGTDVAGYTPGLNAYIPAQNTKLAAPDGTATDVALSVWIDIQDPENGRSEPSNYDNGVTDATLGPTALMGNALRIYRPLNRGKFTFANLPPSAYYLVYVYAGNKTLGQGCKYALETANTPTGGDSWIEIPGTADSHVFVNDGTGIAPIAPAKTAVASNDAAAVISTWGRILAVTDASGNLTLNTSRNTPSKAQAVVGIQLIPYPAPVITTDIAAASTAAIGSAFSLNVVAAGENASDTLAYQWQISTDGGTVWNNLSSTATITGVTTDTLSFSSPATADAALYRVQVTNLGGTVTSTATNLTVTAGAVAPTIGTPPAAQTSDVGGSAAFSVSANGTAPLTYLWEYSSNNSTWTTAPDNANSSTLSLANVTSAKAGYYRVTVSNPTGSITSAVATLTTTPVITTQPAGSDVAAGTNATLSVAIETTPIAATYVWKRNGNVVSDGTGISGATTATLSLTPAQSGIYTVTISNAAGSVTSAPVAVNILSASLAASSHTPGAAAVNPDARLTLTFNEAVSAGVSGLLRIYDASNNSVVDTIDLAAATALRDTLRAAGTLSTQLLPVQKKPIGGIATDFNYYPLTFSADGKTVTIHPRNGVLARGKNYYVKIEPGVFVNAAGESFAGINDTSSFAFSTKSTGPATGAATLTVADDGTGDFDTIQAALDFVPAANSTPVTIKVLKGTYNEILGVQSKNYITLLGEDVDQTVITYANNNNFNNVSGIYHRSVLVAQNVTDFTLANITVRNATPQGGSQAEAVVINGSSATASRNIVTACKLYSYQDTVLFNKQTYISDTYIEGDVDFMWGDGPSFFDNCDIRILRTGGYFTQIRNDANRHGFVYNNCRFTAGAGFTGSYLGRIDPRAGNFPYSEVVIVDSVFGDAANNTFLATATGVSGVNYAAGWWLFNNVAADTDAANIRYWANNITDANAQPVIAPYTGLGSVMPSDLTTQANYRDAYWVLNTNLAGTSTGTWTPALAPIIIKQPASQSASAGAPVTLSVTAIGIPDATYQWQKNGANITGATSATYTISAAQTSDSANYTVVVTCGSANVTSTVAALNISGAVATITMDGYASTVTGGAAGSTITVSTLADLKTNAESATPCIVVVSGTIDLGANGRIKPKSNKTIRGADTDATILGTIEISNATNVIVSNLTISADTGAPSTNDGVTIDNSTNILVTKCTIFNCTDGNLDIAKGSDLVTVSWCKFYYTRDNGHNFSNLVGSADDDTGTGPGQDGLSNYRITWHHNWWSDGAKQRMIACRFGSSHMFNNYWSCSGNDYCTESRNIASIFSEYNYYKNVKAPLGKRTALPNDVGLLMTLGNIYEACTGAQAVDTDNVFAPPYSYYLDAAASVPAIVMAGAGNVALSDSTHSTAAITNPTPSVTAGANVTLTAAPDGFTPASYQWRRNNAPIPGATSATLTLSNAQAAQSGNYTVVLGLTSGGSIVSTPAALTIAEVPGTPVINSALTATGSVGTLFTYNTTVTNPATSFSALGLPAGFTIDTATGVISGTATTAGIYVIEITATNAIASSTKSLVLTIRSLTAPTIYVNDSFADGTRATQSLPASAAWWTSSGASNFTATTGAATQGVSSSRTIIGYFTDSSASPVTLAAGESLTLDFTCQFSGFDTFATGNSFYIGLLRSVANPAATTDAAIGFTTDGPPNTVARASADFGGGGPACGMFLNYTGYMATTKNRGLADDAPVSFYTRNGSNNALISSTAAWASLTAGTADTSVAMATATDYKGTLTVSSASDGSVALTYKLVKASDNSVIMQNTTTIPASQATAIFTSFDTVAFYVAKNASSANYNFILKNVTVTKSVGSGSDITIPVITTTSLPAATQNAAYSATVSAGNSPVSFSATGLPAGLSIDNSGVISGTATTAGNYEVTITATNASGASVPLSLIFKVVVPVIPAPVITSDLTASGAIGTALTYNIVATNTPTSYSADGLPSGFNINTATGAITGTPSAAGIYVIEITATNAGGSDTQSLVLTVPPAATSTVLLNDSFADGTRATQSLPASAAWWTSSGASNFTATIGAATQGVSSARTIIGYFTDSSASPVALAAGESLTLDFTCQFSGFDTASTGNSFYIGLLRSVANPAATTDAAIGFTTDGPPNTVARASADFGGGGPACGMFLNYTGYMATTKNRGLADDAPVSFYTRNGSNNALISSTAAWASLTAGTADTSVAMATAPDYKGTLTVSSASDGSVALTYKLVKASDNSVIMQNTTTIPASQATAIFTSFDTVAFYVAKNASSANYNFILKNVTVTKSSGSAPAANIPVITTTSLSDATQNATYSATIAATNSPTAFSATGLPSGLSIDNAGVISGTPAVSGTFTVVITATNANGASLPLSLSLVVNASGVGGSAPVISGNSTAGGTVGSPFSYTITASNSPTSYALASGSLPAGVTLNTTSGLIGGTPTASGTFNVTLTATNANGTSASFALTITIASGLPVINSAATASGMVGAAFSYQITASNTPTSYALASGSLPAGVTLNTTSGLIGGTPTASGTFNVTLTATNANGTSAPFALVITIATNLPVISGAATANGTVGTAFSYQITASNTPTGYALASGSLPAGVTLNTTSGLIGGTPTASGTFNVTLTATNPNGTGEPFALAITIVPVAGGNVPVINSAAGAGGTVGRPFTYTITAGNSPASYAATGLPAGLTLNTTSGVISGTPTVAGTFTVTLIASNANGNGSAQLVITINAKSALVTYAGVVDESGIVNGPAALATFDGLSGAAADKLGNLYIADTNNNVIRRIDPNGVVTTFAGQAGVPGSANGTAANQASFNAPSAVVADATGSILYVADTGNNTIRKIDIATGMVTTLAGNAGPGGSADGVGNTAGFSAPQGLAIDLYGNLYIADTGNNTIRRISLATATVSTIAGSATAPAAATDGTGAAARFDMPMGIATDPAGACLYIADTGKSTIRVIALATASVTTLAGSADATDVTDGIGSAARFNTPQALVTDAAGNLYVADTGNNTIRKIDPATGNVTTIAGIAGSPGADDGAGTVATLKGPAGIAIDAAGDIYIMDTGNGTVRVLQMAPAIVTPPASLTVKAGNTATFKVVASGAPTPAYQWTRNGGAVVGGTSATLTITPVSTYDSGTYSVIATNIMGTVQSAAATLSVTPAPNTGGDTGGGSSGGGGGGAPSWWFMIALASVFAFRGIRAKRK